MRVFHCTGDHLRCGTAEPGTGHARLCRRHAAAAERAEPRPAGREWARQ